MLVQYRKLKPIVIKYIEEEKLRQLALYAREQLILNYLINLSQLFALCTLLIGQTKGLLLHLVYGFYSQVFTIIEKVEERLAKKKLLQKRKMLEVLQASIAKLRKYYSQTYRHYSDLYRIAIILYPTLKEQFQIIKEQQGGYEADYQAKTEVLYNAKYAAQTATYA